MKVTIALGLLVMMLARQSESAGIGPRQLSQAQAAQAQAAQAQAAQAQAAQAQAPPRNKKGYLFSMFDLDGDNQLSFQEFQSYELVKRAEMDLFKRYDVNNDGVFDFGEVTNLVLAQTASGVLQQVDKDRNGVVDFDEHLIFTLKAKAAAQAAAAQAAAQAQAAQAQAAQAQADQAQAAQAQAAQAQGKEGSSQE